MIHTSAAVLLSTPPQSRGFQAAGFLNQFARYAVPAFILIAGAGLFHNYGQRPKISLGSYYLRRLSSIGLPYLFWSAVYFAYAQWSAGTYSDLLPRFLVALATASAVYTFYFFPIIVPFYLLFPLVRGLAKSAWLDLVTLLAIVGNGFLVWFSFPHPKVAMGPTLSTMYAYYGNTPFWWMGPFFLGAWLAYRWDSVRVWIRRLWYVFAILSGGLLVWVMQEFFAYVQIGRLAYVATNFRPSAYWYGLVIMLALLGTGEVVAARDSWFRRLLMDLGKYSFGIYLVHPLVMAATGKLLRLVSIGPTIHLALTTVLVLGGSYLLAKLIAKIPGGSRVIGVSG